MIIAYAHTLPHSIKRQRHYCRHGRRDLGQLLLCSEFVRITRQRSCSSSIQQLSTESCRNLHISFLERAHSGVYGRNGFRNIFSLGLQILEDDALMDAQCRLFLERNKKTCL
jgi:hypothetical protein